MWRETWVQSVIDVTTSICEKNEVACFQINNFRSLLGCESVFEQYIVAELLTAIYTRFENFKTLAAPEVFEYWIYLQFRDKLTVLELEKFVEMMPDRLEKVHPGYQSRAVEIAKSILEARRANEPTL